MSAPLSAPQTSPQSGAVTCCGIRKEVEKVQYTSNLPDHLHACGGKPTKAVSAKAVRHGPLPSSLSEPCLWLNELHNSCNWPWNPIAEHIIENISEKRWIRSSTWYHNMCKRTCKNKCVENYMQKYAKERLAYFHFVLFSPGPSLDRGFTTHIRPKGGTSMLSHMGTLHQKFTTSRCNHSS